MVVATMVVVVTTGAMMMEWWCCGDSCLYNLSIYIEMTIFRMEVKNGKEFKFVIFKFHGS